MRKVVVLVMAAVMGAGMLVPGASARPVPSRAQLPALAPAPDDALTDALESGHLSSAEYALHRARSVSRLGEVRDEFGTVAPADPHAATLLFRDLSLRVDLLDGDERDEAAALLARPENGGPHDGTLEYPASATEVKIESDNFVVHYVTDGRHAATPSFAASISSIMEYVWTREITQLGWREPVSDGAWSPNGGNGKFDVYLGDVGADSIYGYCMTDEDQPNLQEQHAYCVLDNDFSEGQFPGVFGLEAASVTAAHEFAHAIQFAYDVNDDYWMLEATATWIEDMVYDDIPSATVNDSYQYLASSSLSQPGTPADTYNFTGFQYGQFIWMRYLSDKFNSPDVIRTLWEHTAEPGNYSTKAIGTMLDARPEPNTDFATNFADFAAWNAQASRFYEEGVNYEDFVDPVRHKTHALTGTTPGGGTFSNVDHLTSRYVSFRPGAGVVAGDQITLSVDLGPAPMQKAMVVSLSPTTETIQEIPLASGAGQLTVPFEGQTEVVLVMSNASNRMRNCTGWDRVDEFACGGTPEDDDETHKYAGIIGTQSVPPGTGGTNVGPVVTNFKAAPNPFTPDCKCRKKQTKIRFNLGDEATLTLTLFKGRRRLAHLIKDEGPLPPRNGYYLPWDGKLGRKKAPAGVYKIKLKAVGDNGITKKTTKVTLKR